MPVKNWCPNYGEPARPRYYAPLPGMLLNTEVLRELRAGFTRDREEHLNSMKSAADRETARFFKDEAKNSLKLWRAADLWYRREIVENRDISVAAWPCELSDELDYVFDVASLG